MLARQHMAFCPPAAIHIAHAKAPGHEKRATHPRAQAWQPNKRPNPIPLTAFGVYAGRLFIFPPFDVNSLNALKEALDLSFNFGYVTPIFFPNSAPVIHPVLEGVFHAVVAWAVLLVGFASLDVTRPADRPRITPFLLGSLFLTNLIYLPYLTLRQSDARNYDDKISYPSKERTAWVKFTESSIIPLSALSILAVSVPWAILARPPFGNLMSRLQTFGDLVLQGDILAYSFCADLVVFALFQGALIGDDARGRVWSSVPVRVRAVSAARFIPFFGLAFYLLQRAKHAPLLWDDEA